MKSHEHVFDYIIVGSGTGGSTLARELSRRHGNILLLEKGKREQKVGSFADALRYYDHNFLRLPRSSMEGIVLWRGILEGGSGFVAMGCFVRSLEEEFMNLGLNLSEEFAEAEGEIPVVRLPVASLSPGGKEIKKAAEELGYPMEMMPKGIDPKKCRRCGNCSFGCKYGAKWSPLVYLDEAVFHGVEVWSGVEVQRALVEEGKATGVVLVKDGQEMLVRSRNTILSAGGLETPALLKASGITEAGENLFVDPLVMVYGRHESKNNRREPQMTQIYGGSRSEGFILSTNVNHPRLLRFIEAGIGGFLLDDEHILGIMVKIRDENTGRILGDGRISKGLTRRDQEVLDRGVRLAKEILEQAGADPKSFIVTKPSGAHPGGGAAMGSIVDQNFETKIPHLYVCDASVLPVAPGLPPMLTIIALAKKLGKTL